MKLTSFFLSLILLVAFVLPVHAASDTALGPRGTFNLVGRITAIDPILRTVTVKVLRGSLLVRPYLGSSITFYTTATTRYLLKTSPTTTAIAVTFDDLIVGKPVSVYGTLSNGIWTAIRITMGAKLTCFP